MNTQLLEEVLQLPVDERLQLAENIWDSVETEQHSLALTPEQRAELNRRIEYHKKNPGEMIPWETARERYRNLA
ncbi:MAG: addiction module protein [Chloracidobacterium sp.]|nr:addiction module protein [Chloracidobacterium sp.]